MEFRELSNPWSQYELPDGTKIRIRHVLTAVKRTGTNDDGSPRYDCSFSAIAVTEPVTMLPVAPIAVKCFCGWSGDQSNLKYEIADDMRHCPKCHAVFKPSPSNMMANAANALGVLTEMPIIKKTDLQ